MSTAVDASGQIPQQPRIDGPRENFAALSGFARPRVGVKDFCELRRRKIGRNGQPGERGHGVGIAVFSQRIDPALSAGVLPHDSPPERLSGDSVPDHRGLSLVGNPETHDRARRYP